MLSPSRGGYWHRPSAFLAAATMASLGAGYPLRLPALATEYGGLPFLVVYLLTVAAVCWPLLASELALGRLCRQDLVGGVRADLQRHGGSRLWMLLPWLYVLIPLLLLSWYAVVSGWMLAFVPRALGGLLQEVDASRPEALFLAVAQDAERSMAWLSIVIVSAAMVVARGLRLGLARAAGVLSLLVLLLLFFLALSAARHGDIGAGMGRWLAVDWQAFGWRGAFEAAREGLFTAALGVGAMLAYGSFLAERARVMRLSALVLVAVVLTGLIAGSLLQALMAEAGVERAGQLGMLFESLVLQAQAQQWRWIPAAIYTLLFLLALGSAMALLEVLVQFLVARWRCTRVFAVTVAAAGAWVLGLATVLTFGSSLDLELAGLSAFALLQRLVSQVAAPLALLLLVIYVGRVWSRGDMGDAFFHRAPEAGLHRPVLALRFALVYPVRIVVLLVVLYSLGVVERILAFWGL